jgi:hypothetical protein
MFLTAGAAPAIAGLHNTPWFSNRWSKRLHPSPTPDPAPSAAPTSGQSDPSPSASPKAQPTDPAPAATPTSVAPDPAPSAAPTPAPSPQAGCPSGYSCFTPFNYAGSNYGAGGTTLPTLSSPHTYTCTSGDNTSALQASVNASGDVLISSASTVCQINGTITMPSNKQLQCQNSSTELYNPTTTTSPWTFYFYNVSNSGISNCTLEGNNTIDPSFYPNCSNGYGAGVGGNCPESSSELVEIEGNTSNIKIVDNLFYKQVGQGGLEAYGGASAPAPISNITVDWNSFEYCASYGTVFDDVINSDESHNYALDCTFGNELDNNNQTLSGVTENDNYMTRDYYGDGGDYILYGPTSTNPFSNKFLCGDDDQGGTASSGCSATGNVIDGNGYSMSAFIGNTSTGTFASSYSSNYCFNGCSCYYGANSGCIASAP